MSDVTEDGKLYLTKLELAKRWRVKTRTIEKWVFEGKIPAPVAPSSKIKLWALDVIYDQELLWKNQCQARDRCGK